MDLDGLHDALSDSREPEQPRERVWRTLLKILAIMLVLVTIVGAFLVLVLYLVSIGVLTAWIEWWDT